MIALIDNFDSFTWNIYDYLLRCGIECACFRNNEINIDHLSAMPLEGIVLSPGPGRPKEHELIFPLLEYFHEKLPILGICLGHQAIAEFFGCYLIKAPLPVHGKQSRIKHLQNSYLYENIADEFLAGRYHSLIINDIKNSPLQPTSYTLDDHLLMSFSHTTLPLDGIQYHPESVLTPSGLQILMNWTNKIRKSIR